MRPTTQPSQNLKAEREHAHVVEYGRFHWTMKHGRQPRFHKDVASLLNPFDLFDLEETQASKLIENSFYICRKRDLGKIAFLTFSQATALSQIAVVYSVYLWVLSKRRLPNLHSDKKVEKSAALYIETTLRRSGEFRKLQFSDTNAELKATASRLAEQHSGRCQDLSRTLVAAMYGYSNRELSYFNRYSLVTRRLQTVFERNAAPLSIEEWAYVLGDIHPLRLRRVVDKFTRLIGHGKIVQDPQTQRYVPSEDVTLDMSAYHSYSYRNRAHR